MFRNFFLLQSALDSEFFGGGVWVPTFFVMHHLRPKNFFEFFHLQSALDSEFLRGSVWAPTFFGHTKFEVKTFFGIFFIYRVLLTLNFSEGGLDTNFLSCQI